MTKYSKLVPTEKKVVKTVFTHSLDGGGNAQEDSELYQDWDNVKLLEGKKGRA